MAVNALMILALSPLLVPAQKQGNGNLTVAFFADDQEARCQDNDISDALVLTTSSIPRGYTCFNVTDIFSQDNDVGFQNDSSLIINSPSGENDPPWGVEWLLRNRDSFDSDANYSRVWYEQVNVTGDIKAGADGPWVFFTYAFEDCEQLAPNSDEMEPEDYPWFETSCQTEDGGQCQGLMNPIKSFAISPGGKYNAARGCNTWAEMGSAARLDQRAGLLAAAVAGVAACFLVL